MFSRQFDRRVWTLLATVAICGGIGTPLLIYVAWPDNVRIGYRPAQPIAYSHVLHAGSMQINCRYCHTEVDKGPHATVPPLTTRMNCHSVFKGDKANPGQIEKIKVLLDHWEKGSR
ncbi:MAG: cytochrome c3 family protein [Candidatus Sumerlaeota bacterium]|nr:cytochrome c3 family protein [Candidatus Sumerlaeota bacterium]